VDAEGSYQATETDVETAIQEEILASLADVETATQEEILAIQALTTSELARMQPQTVTTTTTSTANSIPILGPIQIPVPGLAQAQLVQAQAAQPQVPPSLQGLVTLQQYLDLSARQKEALLDVQRLAAGKTKSKTAAQIHEGSGRTVSLSSYKKYLKALVDKGIIKKMEGGTLTYYIDVQIN